MYWSEETEEVSEYQVPDDIVDLSFKIRCKAVPNDHAWVLSQAVRARLPWLSDDPRMGIHLIHGAESMNGWIRPEEPDALIHLSRRTKFTLRVQSERIEDALQLQGETLSFDGHSVSLGEAVVRELSTYEVQFSRHVAGDPAADEENFLGAVAEQLQTLGIKPRKLLCGISQDLRTPDGDIHTRSVMIADLEPAEAVTLQQHGIGDGRILGCGIFVPHKGIKAVKPA
jgi:CRISPR-associated protein Cas6